MRKTKWKKNLMVFSIEKVIAYIGMTKYLWPMNTTQVDELSRRGKGVSIRFQKTRFRSFRSAEHSCHLVLLPL